MLTVALAAMVPEVAHAAALPQDVVQLTTSRKPLRGSVTHRDDNTVVFNPYFSTHAAMTWGVDRLPRSRVKAIHRAVPAQEDFWLRLGKAKGSADALLQIVGFCKKSHLRTQQWVALEWALRAAPSHQAARKEYGTSRADAFVKRDPLANPELARALDAWLQIADPTARLARTKELIEQFDLPWKSSWFNRVYRSGKQPRGTTHERKLNMHGDTIPGVYTLFVPDSYRPYRPAPLLLVLHGGGRDGNKVIGSGREALTLYIQSLRRRDFIVVCPNALWTPWAAPVNEPMIAALLAEIEALFNIDRNREYVAGHSMGGYGTWHYGPKYCDRWAAIGALSGGGSNGFKKLRDTSTFVYLYHGGNDARVTPGDSRAAARQLLKGGNDFVYTELPDSGHSCPDSIVDEMLDAFARKRLTIKKRLQVRTRSSFLNKPSKDELQYLGE